MSPRQQRRSGGFTLIEIVFVLAVIAIILAAAAPSYRHFMQRQELRLAADTLVKDLRNARELSVSSNRPIFVNYRIGRQWCWGVSRGQPCDCAGLSPMPACNISQSDSKLFPDVVIEVAQDLEFSPKLGQVAQSGATALRSLKDHQLRVVLNPMGRVSVCGPDSQGGTPC